VASYSRFRKTVISFSACLSPLVFGLQPHLAELFPGRRIALVHADRGLQVNRGFLQL